MGWAPRDCPDLDMGGCAMTLDTAPERISEHEELNRECFCISVDREALSKVLAEESGQLLLLPELASTHPHLFSGVTRFLPGSMLAGMLAIVSAVEKISAFQIGRASCRARGCQY